MNQWLALGLISLALQGAPGKLKVAPSVDPARAAPGEKLELRLDLEVFPGWHIYSPDYQGGSIKTSLTLDAGPYQADGPVAFPAPVAVFDKILEEELRTHEGKFRYTQPVRLAPEAPPGKLKISGKLTYQACNESICDPPMTVPVEVEIEVGAAAALASPASPAPAPQDPAAGGAAKPPKKPLADLGGLPGLPGLGGKGKKGAGKKSVDFTVSVEPAAIAPGGKGEIVLRYDLAEGFHLYATDFEGTGIPTRIKPDEKIARAAGKGTMEPPPKIHEEVALGEKQRILEGKGLIRQPIEILDSAPEGKGTLKIAVTYMVCDESSCSPGDWSGESPLEVSPRLGAAPIPAGAAPAVPVARAPGQEKDLSFWGLILIAIGSGFFALVMPCTYPMIPITISYFTKQAEAQKKGVLPLALAYGAGIVVDFVVIGLVVGPAIIPFAQVWPTNAVFASLFIVFSLSLFGLYEIRLPAVFQRLAGKARGSSGYWGVFLLGTTLVITSFTCSAPVIGIVFATGAQARGSLEIAAAMGAFGLTMAAPFVALALFPSKAKSLPRSGEWMHTLKVTLGFVEIAAALKFISNVDVVLGWHALPQELFFYLLAGIAACTAIYLFGAIRLRGEPAEIGPGRMIFGVIFAVSTFYFLHCAPLHPLNWVLAAFAPPYRANEELVVRGVQAQPWTLTEDDFDGGLARARQEGKLALINWTGVT